MPVVCGDPSLVFGAVKQELSSQGCRQGRGMLCVPSTSWGLQGWLSLQDQLFGFASSTPFFPPLKGSDPPNGHTDVLLVGFPLVHPLCRVPLYPVHPGSAFSLKLQRPPCLSQHFPCWLGMLPGRRMAGAAPSPQPHPRVPQPFEGLVPRGWGGQTHGGCVKPISSPRNVYLAKFNSPAGFHPSLPS